VGLHIADQINRSHRRCAAGMCWIKGLGVAAKVPEYPVNSRGRLDAGDDTQPAAALPAGLDVDKVN
jgi:hypothetical protein